MHAIRESGVTSGVAQTQAEAAVMESTAAKFEQVNESLQQMLSSLMAELEVLQQAWRGQGGYSFQQVKEHWARDQRSLAEALVATAAAIRTSGTSYSNSDSEAASRLAKTQSSISLPL